MDVFKAALVMRDRVYVPDHDSHDRMLRELGVEEDEVVLVNLAPFAGVMDSDPKDWRYRCDQEILPDWYDAEDAEARVRAAVSDWCKVHVLREGEHEVHGGSWIVGGTAKVRAYDACNITAFGRCTVLALGGDSVLTSSTVAAYDYSKIKAWGKTTVTAHDYSAVDALDDAVVDAWDSSTVDALGYSVVRAMDRAHINAWYNSTVILPKSYQTRNALQLHDDAVCIDHKTNTIITASQQAQKEANNE